MCPPSVLIDEEEEKMFHSTGYCTGYMNIFYVSSTFFDVKFFFLTRCSFDVHSTAKPLPTKKSQCCCYSDRRITLTFSDDFFLSFILLVSSYSIIMQEGLYLVIINNTVNSLYKNVVPFLMIGSLPILRSDFFSAFLEIHKFYTLLY